MTHAKSPWLRLRQGAIFLGGALVYPLLVYGPLDFDWTPLLLGLVYLLAALAGGREGGFWSTACVLCGWGLAVVLVREANLEAPESAATLAGAGAGMVAAGMLGGSAVSAGAVALVAGLVYAVQDPLDVVLEPELWTIALGLVGAANVLMAVGRPRHGETPEILQ